MKVKLRFYRFIVSGLCLFTLILSSCLPASCRDTYTVSVEKAPPVVSSRYFDLANPPEDLPPLNPGEKGITQAVFDLVVSFKVKVVSSHETDQGYVVTMSPSRTRVKLALPITIWIPNGAPEKFLRHEQGHNFINQQIYEDADKVVRFFAITMGDSRYRGVGPSYNEALVNAYKQAGEELNSLYRRYVYGYSMCVSSEYDKLTRHGLNNFPEVVAIEQAFDNCGDYGNEFHEIREFFKLESGNKKNSKKLDSKKSQARKR